MDFAGVAPWGLSRVSDRLPESPPGHQEVVLDPVTQTARYLDHHGHVIDMGRHGTSRTKGTATKSGGGGGDGAAPEPEKQDDNTTDYESDT